MPPAIINESIKKELQSQLDTARYRSDEIFRQIRPAALYERPIAERHRIVFYLGHLEAFDWNLICNSYFEMSSPQKELDHLFAFGIDPTNGKLPQDQPHDWPPESEVRKYNSRIRGAIDSCLLQASDDRLFRVAIEHRLMHVETLAYMLHWLPFAMKYDAAVSYVGDSMPVAARQVDIPAGIATLGMKKDTDVFGWDNEFGVYPVETPGFAIDRYKVSNGLYLEFVNAGGYRERSYWSPDAWDWISGSSVKHPRFWERQGEGWSIRTMFASIPFQPAWPVYVSHAEASAYARWKGLSLPTEAQYHRAAFGEPGGAERPFPWGSALPQARHGNFDFQSWDPARVDAHPDGDSAFGVGGLVGNGWEWTATTFAPFPGFEKFAFYPGYSADFFDGKHYVMKGGSARTASILLRRSFRNWFQPFYPNIYASFRCVEN